MIKRKRNWKMYLLGLLVFINYNFAFGTRLMWEADGIDTSKLEI